MNKIKLMIEVDEGQEYENLKRGIGMADTLRNAKRIEESEDAISRQQVKSDYADWYGYGYQDNWFYKYLNSIPSVKPQSDVLDRIKAEISMNAYPIVHGVNNHELGMSLYGILQVIDKYRKEREK